MAVYNIAGDSLSNVYGVNGTALQSAYDVDGTQIFGGSSPVINPMDWTNMSATYKANIDSAVQYAQAYMSQHSGAYAFPVLTDVHDKLYNEPNYVLYNHHSVFDKFLFLGDIANDYSQLQLDNAVDYMEEADSVSILDLIGNHEYGGYESGQTLPKVWYSPLLPPSAVLMQNTDCLVYYFDDSQNNVRYIALDNCTPIYTQSGTMLYTKNELEFFASALDSATGDIILLNHAPNQSYYYVTDTEKTTSISTTGSTNRSTLDGIINAFINRTSYTFTDDSSISHTHDYSSKTGKFIGLFSGHTHHAGFNNANGYNVYICPSSYYNTDAGMSVFVIDPTAEKVLFIIGYRTQNAIGMYEYAY